MPCRVRIGAGNRVRTGDIQLGKLTLYQLSYARSESGKYNQGTAPRKSGKRADGYASSAAAAAERMNRRPAELGRRTLAKSRPLTKSTGMDSP